MVPSDLESNEAFTGYERVALFVVLEGAFNVAAFKGSTVLDIFAVSANEAARCNQTADNFETAAAEILAEAFCGENFHGSLIDICAHVVGLDTSFLEHFEIVNRGLEVCLTDTVDGETYGVFTGIENAVLAGAIVLELEHYVAIIELINVLSFSLVNLFHKKSSS